jgi:DNA primase
MVIFPYLEYDEIVYWQGRSSSPFSKEFLFPDDSQSNLGKSHFIYGFDNAEVGCPLIITEAIFCALTIGPGGAASGGADLVNDQLRKIRMLNPSHIVLAPDNDEAGLASLYNNWKLLNPYYKIYFVLPPKPHKDWNDHVRHAKDKVSKLKELRQFISEEKKPLTLRDAIKFRLQN